MKFNSIAISSVVALLALCGAGCNSAKQVSSAIATTDFKVSCLDCDNGVELLRAWGKGNNKSEALDRCRKAALEAVLFTGITNGSSACSPKPLLPGANARENNRDFFNSFFGSKGTWKKFAKLDEKRGSRLVSKSSTIENWEASVSVDRNALAQYLMENEFQVAL